MAKVVKTEIVSETGPAAPAKAIAESVNQVVLPQQKDNKPENDTPVQNRDGVNTDQVKYIIYLLYKANILARNNLKEVLQIIEQTAPDNLLEYLVKESRK